ncbi:MAG TPA: hypothetical protein VFX50_02655, partial [Gemmatimonadales bacterium]|nr:hypothetical protein [Gemmatimonadales bacterium]
MGDEESARAGASDTRAKAILWQPPEGGAAWDSAANRYALGAMVYEMMAGAHPFGGAGLRHALKEASEHEAAPFVPEVARGLPAGLQSLVLKLIARDPSARPKSASDIVERFEEVVGERVDVARPRASRAEEDAPADAAPAPIRARE